MLSVLCGDSSIAFLFVWSGQQYFLFCVESQALLYFVCVQRGTVLLYFNQDQADFAFLVRYFTCIPNLPIGDGYRLDQVQQRLEMVQSRWFFKYIFLFCCFLSAWQWAL